MEKRTIIETISKGLKDNGKTKCLIQLKIQ
jgi:hypothetical protein